jgi:hypothetical protein
VLLVTAGLGVAGWLLMAHPPVRTVEGGEIGVRTNQLTGSVTPARWQDPAWKKMTVSLG